MSKKKKAAAKAAQRRMARKARQGRETVAGDGVLEQIASYLKAKEYDVSIFTPVSEDFGSVKVLHLYFLLQTVSGADGAEVGSRILEIRVFHAPDSDSVDVVAPFAWSLEGVPDQSRARIFEGLAAFDSLRVNTRYHDDALIPTVSVAVPGGRLSERVEEAVKEVLLYVGARDASVRGASETGVWVEPEGLELDDDTVKRIAREYSHRYNEEYQARGDALWSRYRFLSDRIWEQGGNGHEGNLIERLNSVGEGVKDGEFSYNAAFVIGSGVKIGGAVLDLDSIETEIQEIEALLGVAETDSGTTS